MAPATSSHSKSSTRASSRYSLSNLASVGKALADVINKDNSTSDKAKRTKEVKEDKEESRGNKASGRRSITTVESDTARRRQPVGAKPSAKDVMSPGATITSRSSRRMSAQPDVPIVSEDGVITNKSAASMSPGATRRASLRPRPNGSALPKYRPRSMLVEAAKKQSTPPRTRRQQSSSDNESELTGEHEPDDGQKKADLKPMALEEKSARSISPLPKRARERQTNIPVTVPPSTPVSKVKIPTRKGASSPVRGVLLASRQSPSPPPRASPASGAKAQKAKTSSIPRPPSSASVSSSSSAQQVRTPQTPTPVRSTKKSASPGKTGSPLRQAVPRHDDSPLGKFVGKKTQLSPVQGSPAGSEFVEGNSVDSAADVEFMLGAIVSPTAPTPAIPRLRMEHVVPSGVPETPSRLPNRNDMSYLSPLPPGSGRSPRPVRPNRPGYDRGSLLSWEQLAAMSERSLGEGEMKRMLADIPAPFSTPSSPALSAIDLPPRTPESPSLSSLPSPAGYGSISQVLLPDVTPSPAPVRLQYSDAPEDPSSAVATMLRLQLAAAERLAGERLYQLQVLEAQLGNAKEARMRDTNELAAHVNTLEEQMRAVLDARDRAAEEHTMHISVLEEQLRTEALTRGQAVQVAVARAGEEASRRQAAIIEAEGRRWMAVGTAARASVHWGAVSEVARSELEFIAASRDALAVLLSSLSQFQI
ncbi:hypothetical protein K488DRAFT_49781 [Vararia minispora EC-137]|uniref:Uncharacterized protein n=1 Tax=Vararia minispora EC-137 TaxID=1314806 RepID=A0ACB8QLB1_9AGAM|nr:hypothetical protein K488DRAFT_49781 [Vararia minispora EC-137]